jgi:dynactin complex subunit
MTGGDGRELYVGDTVDVPGGMHGTVKFVGTVRGKKGVFAGVELSKEFAARGKNDGDVDGYVAFVYFARIDHCPGGKSGELHSNR